MAQPKGRWMMGRWRWAEFKSPKGEDELTLVKGDDGSVTFETVNGDSKDVHVVYLDKQQVQAVRNILKMWRGSK